MPSLNRTLIPQVTIAMSSSRREACLKAEKYSPWKTEKIFLYSLPWHWSAQAVYLSLCAWAIPRNSIWLIHCAGPSRTCSFRQHCLFSHNSMINSNVSVQWLFPSLGLWGKQDLTDLVVPVTFFHISRGRTTTDCWCINKTTASQQVFFFIPGC